MGEHTSSGSRRKATRAQSVSNSLHAIKVRHAVVKARRNAEGQVDPAEAGSLRGGRATSTTTTTSSATLASHAPALTQAILVAHDHLCSVAHSEAKNKV